VKNCNGLTQHAVYCPLWAFQSTHFQGFHLGPPHSFVLGSHTWLQNAYNMLATGTIYKTLTLDARFWYGILQSSHLKTSRPCSDTKYNGLANMLYIVRFESSNPSIFTSVVFFQKVRSSQKHSSSWASISERILGLPLLHPNHPLINISRIEEIFTIFFFSSFKSGTQLNI